MQRTLDRRIGRVAGGKVPRDLTVFRHRMLLRARAAVSAMLRGSPRRPVAGRALAGALALGDMAIAELAAIPDGAELRRRDAARLADDHPGTEDAFATRVQSIV